MLSHLTARGFRNLQPLDLEPAAGTHLLLGGNGAGKTSLLEAIYVLATTRSFRAGQIVDCVAHGAGELALWGEVETDHRAALAVSVQEGVRQRSVNGKPTSLADHLAVLPVVAWAAVEIGVLVGAPGARRRFMDRGVVATRPAALEALGRYREALRQKRELLAHDGAGIEIWNELLAATAAEVIRLRAAYVEALRVELAAVLAEVGEVREISAAAAAVAANPPPPAGAPASGPSATEVLFGFGASGGSGSSGGSGHSGGAAGAGVAAAGGAAERAPSAEHAGLRLAEIELRYQPSPPQGLEGPAAIAAVLDRAIERERRRQQPLLGPQRDELEILWGGHELRRVASAGERKALSLLLLAAHGRVIEAAGRRPVYLLDDADAELAPASVAAVWSVFARRVAATGGQLFASSNRPQVWLTLDVDTLWEMEKGRLAPL
ncbi:MAG TPA: AAA family ATPase [Thermoanaerobaculia bacterium]|nr:AAA family ATPase [Thermoanaerobaculia bacterium]